MWTPYHTQYLAYELTRRLSADNAEKLSQSLINATVDLNPHQVEAALFAFNSPLSKGAVLADEVGLGKTIEAGLIVSQLWAERKRRILCIVPASLRKQWNRELAEKFFIDSLILETATYKRAEKSGSPNPFAADDVVVICSYEFAKRRIADVQAVPWDLVVIDEAHRLRNVYKKSNKIARAIRDAVGARPKVLLTATPLQNSLMELYGLTSFVDPHLFGSEETFREQFVRLAENEDGTYQSLKSRIAGVCQRTLRRQVREYVRYTDRMSITQDFTPTADELRLYESVSAYLQKPQLFALPSGQRKLITLILRKILASSSFAISATLGTMIERLEAEQSALDGGETPVAQLFGQDVEHAAEVEEEWTGAEDDAPPPANDSGGLSEVEQQRATLRAIRQEVADLKSYRALADSISANAKGMALLTALRKGFEKQAELGAPQKALIFTESRRTQAYLVKLLSDNGYLGQVVTFNGTNTDPDSKAVYNDWLKRHEGQDVMSGSPTADMRSALVDEFRDRKSIMVATESAAEGVNLQFCNLVVNYDLPWNPQRIEQRIGRCHRYGQKHDVVVVNFLNRKNEADQRVFQLLSEKFRLFDGVFGASDEVLGALESGVDFEKRINDIYQSCRTTAEINAAFDQLQAQLEEQIEAGMNDARSKLLENFDEEVTRRLRVRDEQTRHQLDRLAEALWRLTRGELGDGASFDHVGHAFDLLRPPERIPAGEAPLSRYRLVIDRNGAGDVHYRLGHPLAQHLVREAKGRQLESRLLNFDYGRYEGGRITLVEKLVGKSGWLRFSLLSVTALDTEDHLLLAGVCDDGSTLDADTCHKLLSVPADVGDLMDVPPPVEQTLRDAAAAARAEVLDTSANRNRAYFDAECAKLDNWAEDLRDNLERELKELDKEIKSLKKQATAEPDLDAKVALRRQTADREKLRNEKRRSLFDAHDRIEADKDRLIAEIEAKLRQNIEHRDVFTIRWTVVG